MNKIISTIILYTCLAGVSYAQVLSDNFVNETLGSKELNPIETNLNYNYESLENIPIKLQIIENVSSKNKDLYNGRILKFKVREDIFYDNQIIIKKGTIVTGEIEAYLTRGFNGIPATIVLNNFEIPNIDGTKIKGRFIKRGLNLTTLVFPIKWLLTPLPPTGSFTNLIFGGNVKITDKDKILINYYPKWNE